jgi:hypothetical protein
MSAAIGRSEKTIKNVLIDAAHHIPTRQAISDFLGEEIFPDIRPRQQWIGVKLPRRTQIILPSRVAAKLLESVLHGTSKRQANQIELSESVIFRIRKIPVADQKKSHPQT